MNGPTILHICNHFSIHSNKKIMPMFRDFPLFVKLDLTLNKLPRQAGMSMPSAPHLCQELLVNWTGESIWVYILIYMVRTIHVGMMVCELKMSIYHIYIEPSVSIVRWWEDRCKKSWSQFILWHWKGRSAYFSFCNEPGQLTSEVLTAMPHVQVYPPSSLLQLYMKRHIPFKLFQNHTIHLGLWWLSQTTTWF